MTTVMENLKDMSYGEYKNKLKNFKFLMKKFIVTTRFTNETWEENKNYRIEQYHNGCLYCAPDPLSLNINKNSIVFVLEMNNEINSIMGIGLIRNNPKINSFQVYDEKNYNRYVFMGEYRIDRTEMDKNEETIMKVFDILCFKGNKHMKRGQGLKCFPQEMLFKMTQKIDLVEFISNMFKKRIKTNT